MIKVAIQLRLILSIIVFSKYFSYPVTQFRSEHQFINYENQINANIIDPYNKGYYLMDNTILDKLLTLNATVVASNHEIIIQDMYCSILNILYEFEQAEQARKSLWAQINLEYQYFVEKISSTESDITFTDNYLNDLDFAIIVRLYDIEGMVGWLNTLGLSSQQYNTFMEIKEDFKELLTVVTRQRDHISKTNLDVNDLSVILRTDYNRTRIIHHQLGIIGIRLSDIITKAASLKAAITDFTGDFKPLVDRLHDFYKIESNNSTADILSFELNYSIKWTPTSLLKLNEIIRTLPKMIVPSINRLSISCPVYTREYRDHFFY
ncbi:hypothetical protein I4U23_000175 [Adineta vaga]|nr:hypothetical protein I4U23_000175 [Adineta vaga]